MKHQLAGVLNDRHRQIIHAVVEEVTTAPLNAETSIAVQMMPITMVPAAVLEHEIISGSGGSTNERQLNTEGKSIPGHSAESKIYEPGSYQEFIPFNEKDLLRLRKHGTLGERGVAGTTNGELDMITRAAEKLKRRLNNRWLQLIWDALFLDTFTYQGIVKTFGRPGSNVIAAATDWSSSGVGTPFEDLVAIVKTNATLRKYNGIIRGFIINPKTEADVILRALEAGFITNANIGSADINEVMKFAAPGIPPFIVVNDAVQAESIDPVTQKIVLADAEFLVPDDRLLVVMDFDGRGVLFPMYGEMQLTENLNDPNSTVESPAMGAYTFIDEEGLRNRLSPRVRVVSGFNGGPNLMRPFDVIIITV